MKINFYATLRQIVGQKTVEFAIADGITVRELVEAVVKRYPAMRSQLLNDAGELHGHVHVFVNGRDAQFLEDDLSTRIGPEDKVDIFPAVGGG
jgi:molybdopterin synthase sulfur carrier subunit